MVSKAKRFFFQLYWGIIDKQTLYIFTVYNVIFWHMYTLWNDYHNKANLNSKRMYIYLYACVLSCSSGVWLCVTPWTAARQAPLSMGCSRQEYWSGLPCPPPVDLSHPGIKAVSLMSPRLLRLLHWQAGSLQLAPPGTPLSLSFSHTYVRVYTESLCCTTEINTTL